MLQQVHQDVVPEHFRDSCFVSHGLFSKEECYQLRSRMLDQPLKIDTTSSESTLRIVERTSLNDPELADFLYQRIRSLCPSRWVVHEEEVERLGPFSKGEWEISRVDSRIQIYHYKPGGVFGKHTDGATFHSADRRSLFTVLVYLNDAYEGGHTTVYTDDESNSYKVPKGLGSCFVMLQRTLHEGSVVESGEKWALRCDVLYDREGGTSAEDSVKHLNEKQKAKLYYDLASKLELSGYALDSLPYYQKAYRLDPNLEEV